MKMNKYVLIVLAVIILAVFAGVGFFLYNKKAQPEIVNQVGITADECLAKEKGGEIINILDDKRAEDLEFYWNHKADFCKNKADYLGDVVGLKCPCICCKKSTSSFGDDQSEKFITDYLLTQKYFSWKTTTDSRNFCVIENLNPTEVLFPLYVWVRCGEFILQNGELKEVSGKSVPAKINYPNELSYRDLSRFSYEAPRDGSLYSKDIKTIFPLNVQKEIIFSFNIAVLDKKIEMVALSGLGLGK